ncbi:uncharacterized protein BX663DRAFT_488986 [Cokeromyces recurvatus]|uniref:uncharacterized protein n=1 Tax=Cokeromyces recurvatus TaxID=90255 RepID=UPI00221F16CE|nr:uncharacterized protein BX663DRAFT_488986 [Cokeromyces recurvatus]KAI7899764.1 hypothetical protein BX663DRAFT_488986 [Cokeromyces recurvatus]
MKVSRMAMMSKHTVYDEIVLEGVNYINNKYFNRMALECIVDEKTVHMHTNLIICESLVLITVSKSCEQASVKSIWVLGCLFNVINLKELKRVTRKRIKVFAKVMHEIWHRYIRGHRSKIIFLYYLCQNYKFEVRQSQLREISLRLLTTLPDAFLP